MRKMINALCAIFGIALLSLLQSCNNDIPITDLSENKGKQSYKTNMMTASNYVAKSEETEIDGYVKRRRWTDMKRMENGLRIWEYQKGEKAINYDDEVVFSYSVQSISGKDIYVNELDTIVVGRNEPNIGLDKAMLFLHHGSKAKLILPSHLGYGFIGDSDRIGTNMILVYDIEIK
ncbi:MAG: FKBP-type peptidyl-prolyl cis-trans isomerase [Bacteroidales bacterium]|jgi:FKBP-type peptidyl-prolyl cis-trans isomerase|nr:FKBP-type peptidyl-prolyl cis-trans isomerase [Bacteroidales bacterium]